MFGLDNFFLYFNFCYFKKEKEKIGWFSVFCLATTEPSTLFYSYRY